MTIMERNKYFYLIFQIIIKLYFEIFDAHTFIYNKKSLHIISLHNFLQDTTF